MKKNELIQKLVSMSNLSTSQATIAIDTLDDIIMEVIATEDSVRFGWGTIKGVVKSARMCRNPRTGEKFMSEEKHGYPKCIFSKAAKE